MCRILSIVFVLGFQTILFIGCGYKKHPTDAVLQMRFQTNQIAFSNIVAELKKRPDVERIEWKGGIIIANNLQTNPPVLTTNLLPHLASIGPEFIITSGLGEVSFYFSSRGLSVSGSAKGITYHENTPNRIVPDTDVSSATNRPFTVFRPLNSDWYVFYSR